MKKLLLTVFIAILLPSFSVARVTGEACKPFYHELEAVPHESIFQRDGFYTSEYYQGAAVGCFLVMVTSKARLAGQTMPLLDGSPGSLLHDAGWRSNPKYLADGPGTGVVGLEDNGTLCLVYTNQPAYVDHSGQIIQSEHIKVRVECMDGANSEEGRIVLREVK